MLNRLFPCVYAFEYGSYVEMEEDELGDYVRVDDLVEYLRSNEDNLNAVRELLRMLGD